MTAEIACPSCDRRLRVPEELLGKLVKCPSCQSTFTANVDEPAPPPPRHAADEEAPETPSPPRYSIREEDSGSAPRPRPSRRGREDYDDEEPLDSPRRSRRRRDEDYDEDYPYRGDRRADARRQVAGPAIGLMVVGSLALGLSVLNLVLHLVIPGAAMSMGGGGGANSDQVVANMVGGVCGALFGIVWGALILAGAIQMKNLKSYGLGMTASIIAMLPCNGCCILGLPFGIWALVVINKPEVKDAFR